MPHVTDERAEELIPLVTEVIERIRRKRGADNETMFAETLGVDRQNVWRWRNGHLPLAARTLIPMIVEVLEDPDAVETLRALAPRREVGLVDKPKAKPTRVTNKKAGTAARVA
jgi:hypothetical protein